MKTTIVTALYDIGREKFDGRKFEEYLVWFEKTLSLNCSMVVFVPASLETFVRSNRKEKETTIILQELEETPYFHVSERMQEVISHPGYKQKMNDSHRIECTSNLYNCIQYSKFKWMKEAAEIKQSDYFIWMDAGLSRFFDDLDTSKQYPGKNAVPVLEANKDKILVQAFSSNYPDLFYAQTLTEDYFWDNRSFVMGGMFGGSKSAIEKIDKMTEEVLVRKMLDNDFVNNEQIALGYLIKNQGDLFSIFVNEGPRKNHRNYELINQLGAQ